MPGTPPIDFTKIIDDMLKPENSGKIPILDLSPKIELCSYCGTKKYNKPRCISCGASKWDLA